MQKIKQATSGAFRTRAELLDEIRELQRERDELKRERKKMKRHLVAAWRLKEMYKARAASVPTAQDIAPWIEGDRDAATATGHALGCDCMNCCLIRVEGVSVRAIACACDLRATAGQHTRTCPVRESAPITDDRRLAQGLPTNAVRLRWP